MTKIQKIKVWCKNNNVKKIQITHLLSSCPKAFTIFPFPFVKIRTSTVCTWNDYHSMLSKTITLSLTVTLKRGCATGHKAQEMYDFLTVFCP